METLRFKTNIKCSGCIETVTPHLNKLSGVEKWAIDTGNPDKVLTVEGKSGIDSQEVIGTIRDAGYQAEKL